ncbi:TetR/AcrR family transcriptional regulator C-terminal domain-containing protein [Geodermatophilus sabuli]|uniref:Transcriptional regulator, TetR family n=1 Tax=Geodermatophilus sabuli TaxID=1564158 RepID=A0A285EJC6_9ACTN|nr:TetR/AcrR family transcriptional regulator C-terminal domain-containing protein [Geodermatophilus sabuli]MBB3086981.1 TetR/AcrR family tetracycline transcriptional repressor [Geodermatophilus sabuli]SNX99239.1 transcriptional regulator, TetR family [Geodermatophilus sabuli]
MNPEAATERAPVTREAVVDAALALLADGGLEAVSFRRIAARLGVSGPTLYWHVDNKRQLMDLMAEELFRRAGVDHAAPAPGQPWWEWLREDARAMFAALVGTRDAPRVLAGNRPGRESLARIERSLGVLVEAGLTPGGAQHVLFAIGSYVIGSATEWQAEAERSRTTPLPGADDEDANARRAEVLADQPVLLAAITEVLGQPHETTFEFGLDLIIEGLRARYAPDA